MVQIAVKPRANGRKIVIHQPQHCWMLHVESVCTPSLLLVVAQSLKRVKILATYKSQQCWELYCWEFLANNVASFFISQQCCVLFHLPTMLGVVGQQFCVRLHGALVTDILIIFSNVNFSLLIIHMNFCAIYMYPALYAARKISLNFLFWGT